MKRGRKPKLIINNKYHCPSCGEFKPLSEFHRDRSKVSGYSSYCKVCRRPIIQSLNNKIKTRERLENPLRFKAMTKVYQAVKSGKLLKFPCEVCHTPKVQAHHNVYTKPLDVVWVCQLHHAEIHWMKRKGLLALN